MSVRLKEWENEQINFSGMFISNGGTGERRNTEEKQLYCDDIFAAQRVENAFKSGDKDAGTLVIMNEKKCHFTAKPVKVIKTMNWPDSQLKKIMIVDPSMPDLAGLELWTFGFSLSRK